jgi:translocation and assembly module TamB
MATVDLPRTKRHASSQLARLPAAKKKSHAFRYGCLFMLGMLLAGTWFAPAIVAHTPLRQWIVRAALKLDSAVSLESVSLGWFSSVIAEKLEIRDATGNEVLEVDSLSTEKPLIGLLLDFADLGQVRVERPTLHIVCQDKETNIEQVFAALLSGPGNTRLAAQLEVSDGTILIDDVPTHRQFRIENVSLNCTIADANEAIILAVSGSLPHEQQPASFKVDLRTQGSANVATALANGKIDCASSALPLELFAPLVRRFVEQAQLSGRLSARLGGAWGQLAEGGETSVSGEALITELDFAAAALGTDHIQIDRVEVPCHIVQTGDLVQFEQLAIHCDLGNLSLAGSAKTSDFSAADKLSALAHENYELKANVDLARLAGLLRETLHIRAGTEITSGQVALVVASRQQPSGMSWTGHVDASHLGAQTEGRALTWENPLSIQFVTHEAQQGLVVDRAQCTSTFLQATAAGSIDDLTASANFDLARLVAELRQFSDLNNLQLAGNGQAQIVWKRVADNQFSAETQFQARNFQFLPADGRAWTEEQILVKLDVGGQLQGASVKSVERAVLAIDAGNEHLEAQLQEAVVEPMAAIWPIQCSWRGQMDPWAPRLEACLGIAGWDLRGAGTVEATVRCSSKALDVEQAKADFAQFQAWGHDWFISEPAVVATIEGHWDIAKSRIDVPQARFAVGNTVALVNHAVVQSTADGWAIDGGTAELEAELANLYRWRHDPRMPAVWQMGGKLTAEAQLKYDSGATTGRLDGTIHQLRVVDLARSADPAAPAVWQEPQVQLSARGTYQHHLEQLQIEKIQLASEALRCDVSGTAPLSAQGGDLDLKGTVQYDWDGLAPLWRPYVGPGVQISGRQIRALAVHGRLSGSPTDSQSWRQVTGDAALGWTGMDIYGLRVAQGDVACTLADGQLRAQPIDVAVSEGRFTFAPLVRLSPAPAQLLIARGPLLTDIHLSPELCARGLKFVAPILAESTVAEGRFSITMDGGFIPLADPGGGDASGHMAIQAQARPGPLAQEFTMLIGELTTLLRQGILPKLNGQSGSLLSINDSEIDFRLVQRRVYHRGLTFMVGAMPITTHGSVGFDESLSIVAEIPIQATFLGFDLSLGALEGQTLRIPIEGTLQKPKLDRSGLQQLAGKLLQNTARGALLNEVNKQFERLLPVQP